MLTSLTRRGSVETWAETEQTFQVLVNTPHHTAIVKGFEVAKDFRNTPPEIIVVIKIINNKGSKKEGKKESRKEKEKTGPSAQARPAGV